MPAPAKRSCWPGIPRGRTSCSTCSAGGGGGPPAAPPPPHPPPAPTTPPISSTVAGHVTAVATFGDPRHVVNQAFDLGTSRRNGLFPRSNTQLGVLAGFANRIHA